MWRYSTWHFCFWEELIDEGVWILVFVLRKMCERERPLEMRSVGEWGACTVSEMNDMVSLSPLLLVIYIYIMAE